MPQEKWEYTVTRTQVFRYRMKSTGASSHKYGNCEVCGQHASEVFHQVEERQFFLLVKGSQTRHSDSRRSMGLPNNSITYSKSTTIGARPPLRDRGWTRNKCTDIFGHYDCLVSARRKADASITIAVRTGEKNANEER